MAQRIKPCLLVYESLPPRIRYSELLGGQRHSEVDESAGAIQAPESAGENLLESQPGRTEHRARLQWRSCALSTAGKRRKLNEDAYLDRTEIGLWAVADGI